MSVKYYKDIAKAYNEPRNPRLSSRVILVIDMPECIVI